MRKRCLSILLVLALCLAYLPVQVHAAAGTAASTADFWEFANLDELTLTADIVDPGYTMDLSGVTGGYFRIYLDNHTLTLRSMTGQAGGTVAIIGPGTVNLTDYLADYGMLNVNDHAVMTISNELTTTTAGTHISLYVDVDASLTVPRIISPDGDIQVTDSGVLNADVILLENGMVYVEDAVLNAGSLTIPNDDFWLQANAEATVTSYTSENGNIELSGTSTLTVDTVLHQGGTSGYLSLSDTAVMTVNESYTWVTDNMASISDQSILNLNGDTALGYNSNVDGLAFDTSTDAKVQVAHADRIRAIVPAQAADLELALELPDHFTVTGDTTTGKITITDALPTGDATYTGSFTMQPLYDTAAYTAPTGGLKTYTGSEQELFTGGASTEGTIWYTTDASSAANWTTEIPKATDAVTYNNASYMVVGDGSHNSSVAVPAMMVGIEPYATAITVAIQGNIATNIYNGIEQSVTGYTITGFTPADAPLTAADITYSGTAEAFGTNAGSYTMGLDDTQFANNNANLTGTVTFMVTDGELTITQAPAPVLTPKSQTIGYGSTINEGELYELTGLQGTDSATVTVGSWTPAIDIYSPATTPGDYTFTVSAAYDGGVGTNYSGAIAAVNGTLTVSPLPTADYTQNPVPTVPTYNGQPQEIIAAATDQGEIQYSRDGGTTWSATVPTETNAGDYDVAVKIVGTPGAYVDSAVFGLNAPIEPAEGLTLAAKDTTLAKGTAISDTDLYQLTAGELKGTDAVELTVDWVAGTAPDVNVPGDYEFNIAGYHIAAPGLDSNYQYLLLGETLGTLTIEAAGGGGGGGADPLDETSYNFTRQKSGIGSYTATDKAWTWGERADLPKDVANYYKVLVENSMPASAAPTVSGETLQLSGKDYTLSLPGGGSGHSISSFLASDDIWTLPAENPSYGPYNVAEVLVCEDHEPNYRANGDGQVDQSTFGNSDFYTVGVGTGDMTIDYPNLTTGDVVTNKTFNGVFVTKLLKTNNPTFDADLARLKSDTIASFRAFELDHPEVFWLNGSIKLRVLTVTISGVQTSYIFMTLVDDSGFTMRIAEYAASGAIEAGIVQRDAAAAAIIAQLPAGASAREKVVSLNKWFTLNNEYNRSADLNSIGFTPHRSLKSLTSNEGANGPVCDGYSRGFKVICDRIGIPVILDTGVASIGSHSELHMWMRVQVDGTWYGMDCTWNDPIVSGKNGKVSGYENEKYLLVGDDTVVDGAKFGVSHPSNKTAGGTTGVLFASIMVNVDSIEGYIGMPFEDIGLGDWYYEFVKDAFGKRLMGETSEGKFSPQGTATRGQIVQILYNAAGQPAVDENKVDGWYGKAATWAMEKGIVAGYADGSFHGDDTVTREQLATILWAYAGAPAVTGQIGFADAGAISDWAQQPMLWAKLEGIIGGKPGNLADPQGTATRAEIATIFSNFIK